ncbi:MAG: hypothetical protein O7E52_24010 [Candidatus Poribacteria bacterium]|nr:hypothetical protein [Candidatus Poribacteria bacterium]
MKQVNFALTIALLSLCIVCVYHGIRQYSRGERPRRRHITQCAVAFGIGVIVSGTENYLIVNELMSPKLRVVIGSIRNAIIHVIMYHGFANVSYMTLTEGWIEERNALRRQLTFAWFVLTAAFVPYRLEFGGGYFYIYSGIRCFIFAWFFRPIIRWYRLQTRAVSEPKAKYRLWLYRYATIMAMLHPFAVFVTKVIGFPIWLHAVLGLIMAFFFFLAYVVPNQSYDLISPFLQRTPDTTRLGFLATISATQMDGDEPYVLEAVTKQYTRFLGLSRARQNLLVEAGYLRDVGRIRVSDLPPLGLEILDNAETEAIDADAADADEQGGFDYIAQVLERAEVGDILRYAGERWDGSGPHGMKEREIPENSRILAVLEAFVGELLILQDENAALQAVQERHGEFDPSLIVVLARMIDKNETS